MPYHNWGFPRLGSRTGANVAFDLIGVRMRLLGSLLGVSLNTTSSDQGILTVQAVPGGYTGTINYILRGVLFTNASASLATSPTLSVFTAAAGGGSQLVNAQAVTSLTAANLFVDASLTATATTTLLTAPQLFLRTGAANAVAATVDAYFYGEVLP
jgi:hypothetical protein